MSTGAVQLAIAGPGEIIGQNPFVLSGGAGAIWIKIREASGTIRLDAAL
jgi:beta-galactosidase